MIISVAVLFILAVWLFAWLLLRPVKGEHYCAADHCRAALTTPGQVGLAFCDTHLFISKYGASL